jgi:hypothetical protein
MCSTLLSSSLEPHSIDWPPLVTTLVIAATANVAVGWSWGYRSAGAYAAFWALAGLTVLAARNVALRVYRPPGRLELAISLSMIAFAIVVSVGLLLGFSGWLSLASYLILTSALWAASLFLPASPWRPGADSADSTHGAPRVRPWIVGGVGGVIVLIAAFGIAHLSMTLYDALSYHLLFPARWLQERTLSIVPTPFSDEAQAYAPANGELFFLWLMLPFHGDLLARIGQLPFFLLSLVTLYALARRLGAQPQHAVYPAAFFALSRPVVEQAIGANVDLVCATMFLTSLYAGLLAVERNRRADWALWGVGVGLFCGSKYVALIYLPVLLASGLVGLVGRGAPAQPSRLWALPGLLAFGLPWYARNWMAAGSPIYPASLKIAGVSLARGAFDRTAMLNTVFHTTDVRLIPVMAAHAFGPTLLPVWIPAAAIGGWALARRGWWPHAFMFAAPYAMAALYWFSLPVNVDTRFLLPAVAPALLPFAFVFRSGRAWNATVHMLYAAAMAWMVAGRQSEIAATTPWFMQGWTSLSGLVTPEFLLWYGILALLLTALSAAWSLAGPARARWATPLAVALLVTATTVLAIGGEHWCVPSRCEYVDATSPHIPLDLVYGWRWVGAHVQRATVAYTGINLPYPLTGEQLTNHVVYVNIDGRPDWRFHDYDRALRAGSFRPSPPLLATSSGELLPAAQAPQGPQGGGHRSQASRPRYERMEGIRDAWIDNLKTLHVSYLFVSALSAYEIDNVWHDEQGFPIESTWAAADPRAFHLAFENRLVRVFAIDATGSAQ